MKISKELQWIKDRAKNTINIPDSGTDYVLSIYRFEGNLPHNMICALRNSGLENFGVHDKSYCIENTEEYMLQIHVSRSNKQYGGKYIVSFHEVTAD